MSTSKPPATTEASAEQHADVSSLCLRSSSLTPDHFEEPPLVHSCVSHLSLRPHLSRHNDSMPRNSRNTVETWISSCPCRSKVRPMLPDALAALKPFQACCCGGSIPVGSAVGTVQPRARDVPAGAARCPRMPERLFPVQAPTERLLRMPCISMTSPPWLLNLSGSQAAAAWPCDDLSDEAPGPSVTAVVTVTEPPQSAAS
mmetsp:Transcript_16105/g.28735  ORF Transcript_16105/g.28735 Transcript_16105/m.28735 type:complete len:201 (-) Transcript_16105:531-1133(-)